MLPLRQRSRSRKTTAFKRYRKHEKAPNFALFLRANNNNGTGWFAYWVCWMGVGWSGSSSEQEADARNERERVPWVDRNSCGIRCFCGELHEPGTTLLADLLVSYLRHTRSGPFGAAWVSYQTEQPFNLEGWCIVVLEAVAMQALIPLRFLNAVAISASIAGLIYLFLILTKQLLFSTAWMQTEIILALFLVCAIGYFREKHLWLFFQCTEAQRAARPNTVN